MLMDVSLALKNPGQTYPFEAAVEVEPMIVLDDPVRFDRVTLKGVYIGAGDSVRGGLVRVQGVLSADVESRCALCLEPVKTHVEAAVDVSFVKAEAIRAANNAYRANQDDDLDYETSLNDGDMYPLDGYRIDLQPMVEEALVLELPMRFICSEDCKGICPVCGTNRNIAPCTCQEGGDRQNPFSALSELLTEDEEV